MKKQDIIVGFIGTASTPLNATGSTSDQRTINLEHMKEALDSLGPEPIGEWMRSQGYPPEDYDLLLPLWYYKSQEDDLPFMWPNYVKFSPLIENPVLVSNRLLWGTYYGR